MKAFIVVALLVASAAARSFDVDSIRMMEEKSLLNKEIKDDLLFNKETVGHRFQMPKKTMLGDYPMSISTDYDRDMTTEYEVPATTGSWGQRRVTILSLEEITQTALFREYYNIPLFRQFLTQHPIVFQRYIESVLFQQFWTVPAFQQYFWNPVLFYKYIVPQVQIVAKTQSVDFFNKRDNFDSTNVDQYLNKNVYEQGRDVVVGDSVDRIFQGYNSEYTVPYARGYPFGQQFFGKHHMNNQVNYKFLLDKIYKHLYTNQPTESRMTEFEGQTVERELVKETLLRKYLLNNVISREVYEILKTFPIRMIEKYVRVTVGEDQVMEEDYLVKETLLKKYLLINVITPEVYEILKKFPVTMIEKYIHHYFGQEFVQGEYLIKETLLRKYLLNSVISREVYEILKTFPIRMIEKYVRVIVGEDQVMEEDYLVKETLLKKYLLINVITPEVYEILKKLPVTMIEKFICRVSHNFVGEMDFPSTRFEGQTVERQLVKHTLLKKLLVKNIITREVYEVLKTLPLYKVEKYVRQIVGQEELVGELETPFVTRRDTMSPFVTRRDTMSPFVTRRDYNNEIFNTNTFGQKTMYNRLYNNEIVGDRSVPTLRQLLNIRA